MAKQHSDNIEDRFREAAENISFPPNEEAWNKMEALLDKDKRRRPVFAWWFLLLFGLLVGAGVIGYRQFNSSTNISETADSASVRNGEGSILSKDNALSAGPEARLSQPHNNAGLPATTGRDKDSAPAETERVEESAEKSGSSNPIAGTTSGQVEKNGSGHAISRKAGSNSSGRAASFNVQLRSGRNVRTKKNHLSSRSNRGSTNNSRQSGYNKETQTDLAKGRADITNKDIPGEPNDKQSTDRKKDTNGNASGDSIQTRTRSDSSVKNNTSAFPPATQAGDSSSIKSKPVKSDSAIKKSAGIRINATSKKWLLDKGFNISLGARIDATDLHKISLHQFNQLASATVGYRLSNRLSVQAGVVVQKAVYYAGPEDYYVKPGSYLSMYRISKIDAICQIYEIPLSIRYDAVIAKGLRLYAVGGLSSFYMKKENYRYHATGSSGYRMFDSTYSRNKHYFSSAYLAAGVEKKITPVFSVLAEPYAKLPVAGVGAGKVKLYSGGIQVMLRYQPQSNKKSSPKK